MLSASALPQRASAVATAEPGARWPDFLLIGAAKAGTTALFKAIGQHPGVYCPSEKEPRFFAHAGTSPMFAGPNGASNARRIVADEAAYCSLFAACPPGRLAFEASTEYLASERAPREAARRVLSARLIVMLRHPVERAYSQFLHLRAEGVEPFERFDDAWQASAARMADGWRAVFDYRHRGFYGAQLTRWLEHFPREQLLILFYEDWRARPADVLAQVWRHLDLTPSVQLEVTEENVSSRQPHWAWLHHQMTDLDNPIRRFAQRVLPLRARDAITRTVGAVNLAPGPRLDPALRAQLARVYHDDLDHLEILTGRDLRAWRS